MQFLKVKYNFETDLLTDSIHILNNLFSQTKTYIFCFESNKQKYTIERV